MLKREEEEEEGEEEEKEREKKREGLLHPPLFSSAHFSSSPYFLWQMDKQCEFVEEVDAECDAALLLHDELTVARAGKVLADQLGLIAAQPICLFECLEEI